MSREGVGANEAAPTGSAGQSGNCPVDVDIRCAARGDNRRRGFPAFDDSVSGRKTACGRALPPSGKQQILPSHTKRIVSMKYVVLKMTVRGMSREVPVIFPDLISHVNMAASAVVALDAECEGFKKAGDKVDIAVVSAGFLSSMDIDAKCDGQSDSLGGLKSRESEDDELIRMIDCTHGYVG
ncbi:hypothetical protein [Pseudomonas phage PSA25]|uniref:Phage protein n=1 Tax=Pseudomonas phage PSA25 TaxID=2833439 RepID=A0AAE7RC76_9CAUD|nr:hypothetical protein [Pseudomonas phage PSA25]